MRVFEECSSPRRWQAVDDLRSRGGQALRRNRRTHRPDGRDERGDAQHGHQCGGRPPRRTAWRRRRFQGSEQALSVGYQRAFSDRMTITLGGAFSDDESLGRRRRRLRLVDPNPPRSLHRPGMAGFFRRRLGSPLPSHRRSIAACSESLPPMAFPPLPPEISNVSQLKCLVARLVILAVGHRARPVSPCVGRDVRVSDARPVEANAQPMQRPGRQPQVVSSCAIAAARRSVRHAAMLRSMQRAPPPCVRASPHRVAGAIRCATCAAWRTGADVIALSRPLDAAAAASLMRTLAADPSGRLRRARSPLCIPARPQRARTTLPARTIRFSPHISGTSQHRRRHQARRRRGTARPATGVVVAVLDTGITDHPDLDAEPVAGLRLHHRCVRFAPRDRRRACPARTTTATGTTTTRECELRNEQLPRHARGGHGRRSDRTTASAWPAWRMARKCCRCACSAAAAVTPSDIADAIVWASGGSVAGVPDNAEPRRSDQHEPGRRRFAPRSSDAARDRHRGRQRHDGRRRRRQQQRPMPPTSRPASCNNVITVGATRITGGKACYSNFGKRSISPRRAAAVASRWQSRTATSGRTSTTARPRRNWASPRVRRHVRHVDGRAACRGAWPRWCRAWPSTPLTPAADGSDAEGDRAPLPRHDPGGTPMGTGILDAKAAVGDGVAAVRGRPIANAPSTPCRSSTVSPVKQPAGAAG